MVPGCGDLYTSIRLWSSTQSPTKAWLSTSCLIQTLTTPVYLFSKVCICSFLSFVHECQMYSDCSIHKHAVMKYYHKKLMPWCRCRGYTVWSVGQGVKGGWENSSAQKTSKRLCFVLTCAYKNRRQKSLLFVSLQIIPRGQARSQERLPVSIMQRLWG